MATSLSRRRRLRWFHQRCVRRSPLSDLTRVRCAVIQCAVIQCHTVCFRVQPRVLSCTVCCHVQCAVYSVMSCAVCCHTVCCRVQSECCHKCAAVYSVLSCTVCECAVIECGAVYSHECCRAQCAAVCWRTTYVPCTLMPLSTHYTLHSTHCTLHTACCTSLHATGETLCRWVVRVARHQGARQASMATRGVSRRAMSGRARHTHDCILCARARASIRDSFTIA